MNLAIYSPRQTATTETFIQAHRDIPQVDVKFYYGRIQYAQLEGRGTLLDLSFRSRVHKKLRNPLKKFGLSAAEEAIAESFLTEKIDCILAEYGMTGAHLTPIAKALSIPLVVHFHGYDAVQYDVIAEMGEKYQAMFAYAAAIVVVSKKMGEKIAALGCPPEKICLNTYGVHADYLKIEPTYSEKILVGLGRFVDKKAPYYTILAFQKALLKHPDAKLIIGGSGPLYDACINLVKFWNLQEVVSLPGVILPADFKGYMANCRAFVQHSITPGSGDMEGTPLSVLEAQAAGLPVIATYHAGIPDVVLHEKTGLLCEEHDVALMADHMVHLLDNIDLARAMGEAGRKRYIEHFTLERHLSELSRIVHESVNAK